MTSLVMAGPAVAQGPAGAPVALPQIDVTGAPTRGGDVAATRSNAATKTDTPIIETPQSVSVVPRALIEATGAQSVTEAVRYNAGITTGVFGLDPRFDQIYLRGFPLTTFGDYRDGLRQSFSPGLIGFRTEPYGLDRLVILRGPSAVLYGQSPAGGIIDRVSRMPSAVPGGEIVLSLGSFERYQAAFDVTGPIGSNPRLLYRMTGLARDSGSEIIDAPDDRLFLAPAITWRPTDDTSITVLGLVQNDRSIASAAYYTRPDGTPTRVRTDDPSFARSDQIQFQIGYRLEHRLAEGVTLRQNLRYGQADLRSAYLFGTGTSADGRTVSRQAAALDEDLRAFTVDNQLELRFATGPLRHTALAGVDYQYTRSDFNLGFGAAPSLDLANPVYNQFVARPAYSIRSRQTQNQVGLYLQDQIRLGDRWVMTLGGRQDWTETDSLDRVTGITTTQTPSAFTGRIGLVYLAPNGLAPYANYAESFLPTLGTDITGAPFAPTRARQFETGVRYQPPGTESLVTASLFQITVENGLTTNPANINFSVQTGEQRSRGFELETALALGGGFSLLASYTYQDVETTESTGADRGKRPVGIPRHVAGLFGQYQVAEGPLAGLGLGLGLRFNGPSYQDTANTRQNDAYTLVDASVRYDIGSWRVQLNGSNLEDRRAYNCQPGICYHVAGRTLLTSLGYRF